VDKGQTATYRTVLPGYFVNTSHTNKHGEPCRFKVCRAPRVWGYHRVTSRSGVHRTHGIKRTGRPLRVVVVEVVEDSGELTLVHLTVEARLHTRLTGSDANLTSGSEDALHALRLCRGLVVVQSHREVIENRDEVVGEVLVRSGLVAVLEHLSFFLSV